MDLVLKFLLCVISQSIPSCNFIKHSYEINRRFISAMCVIGVGYKGAKKFCGLMDFPPFLCKSTYCMILEHICEASKNMAQFFMKKACNEEIDLNSTDSESKNTDLIVSGDGTWHKHGFLFLFGVTSLIGHFTGKIIDVLVKSSYCKACEPWKDKKKTPMNMKNGMKHTKKLVRQIMKEVRER